MRLVLARLAGIGAAFLVLLGVLGLRALVGHGAAGHPAATITRTVPATPSTRAVTAVPSVSPTLSQAQQRLECGALAMAQMGYGTYAQQVKGVALQHDVSRHEAAALIARAVREACPREAGVLPQP